MAASGSGKCSLRVAFGRLNGQQWGARLVGVMSARSLKLPFRLETPLALEAKRGVGLSWHCVWALVRCLLLFFPHLAVQTELLDDSLYELATVSR